MAENARGDRAGTVLSSGKAKNLVVGAFAFVVQLAVFKFFWPHVPMMVMLPIFLITWVLYDLLD